MKVFVVGSRYAYEANFLDDHFQIVDKIQEAELVIFTGGADINPAIYNEPVSKTTSFSRIRDVQELEAYNACRPDQLKFGICRGAQLLTALAGGKLIQDVNGHCGCGNHRIRLTHNEINNEIISKKIISSPVFGTNSIHHQMMYPYNLSKDKYIILAVSNENLSDSYLNGNDEQINLPEGFEEPEIIYYPEINSICYQGHPEMMNYGGNNYTDALAYCNFLVKKFVVKNK